MSGSTILIFFAFLPAFFAQDQNFCKPNNLTSCGYRRHIDCLIMNNNWKPPASCSNTEPVVLDLQPYAQTIVKKHNDARNRVAGGSLPAMRMGTIRWHKDLAKLASRATTVCYNAGECVNTPEFDYVGRIYDYRDNPTADNRNDADVIYEMIDEWIQFQNMTAKNDIRYNNYTRAQRSWQYKKFIQVVRGFATRIGCGALKYDNKWKEGYTKIALICLYDSLPTYLYPVYEVGPTASKCKTGKNRAYPNLCSVNEYFNVNDFKAEFASG